MSRNNLELARNKGRVWLSYWDSLHGQDVIFELHPEGSITKELDTGEFVEVEKVDFVHALRELAFRIRED